MSQDVRILLVDDEDFYLTLFGDILASRQLQVTTAHSAEEALNQLREEPFDILITDLLMEGMGGLALTQKVREAYPWVDIVVITQKDDVRLAVRTMKMGVFEYLIKPVDRDELLLTMDRLLERRRLLEQRNKLVDESMEYWHAQTVYRRCLDILSTLDPENLYEMILRHMIQATGAQGGFLWLSSPEERSGEGGVTLLNLSAYRGLVNLDDYPTSLAIKKGAMSEAYRNEQPFFSTASAQLQLKQNPNEREALFVPLVAEGMAIGLVLLLDKLKEDFSERDQNIARTMAQFSAIAVKNSRRFQALERVGLRDQGSTAYNLTYFIDYAGKEIYKARRYGRPFSLVNVAIDRFDFLIDHFKPEICQQMSRKLTESISKVVRDSDILAKISDHEYYVLLPETDTLGARMFVRRSLETFWAEAFIRRMGQDYPLSITMGVSTFPWNGADFDELLATCRKEMHNVRNSLQRRLGLGDLDFWNVVKRLVGQPEDYGQARENASYDFRLAEEPDQGSAHGVFSVSLLEGIAAEVAQQAVSESSRGAILYDLGGELDSEQRVVEKIFADAERAKAFVIGKRGREISGPEHPRTTRIYLDDRELETYRILLILGEELAYAFVGVRQSEKEFLGFHTHDLFLVESLIAKLQDQYHFQRQF